MKKAGLTNMPDSRHPSTASHVYAKQFVLKCLLLNNSGLAGQAARECSEKASAELPTAAGISQTSSTNKVPEQALIPSGCVEVGQHLLHAPVLIVQHLHPVRHALRGQDVHHVAACRQDLSGPWQKRVIFKCLQRSNYCGCSWHLQAQTKTLAAGQSLCLLCNVPVAAAGCCHGAQDSA